MLETDASTAVPARQQQAWSREAVAALFDAPFADLMFRAQSVHREHFDPNRVQISQLVSIKTGGCPENCGYCSQSAHFKTGVKPTKLMSLEEVREAARAAKASGVQRLCLGAAWRSPKERDLGTVLEMIQVIKEHGLESCVTLGMLDEAQAQRLAAAGLDYYNHNIDTSREYYAQVATTRSIDDRLATLDRVREAGIKTCCGGIVGMGESRADRAGLLHQLATLPAHPDSLPVNALVPVAGTPLGDRIKAEGEIDGIEFVRTIAVARLVCPKSMVRLSAGREGMSKELQALCFLAGANSIFVGGKLLTTPLPGMDEDSLMLSDLGMRPMTMGAQA
jgi:biotin synthase